MATAAKTTSSGSWARARAFDLALRARVATRVPTRHGFAFRFAERRYWDLNFAYVERPEAPTAELLADADEALTGLGHRMLVVDEPADATRLAADLSRDGWTVERHVAMVAGALPAGWEPRHRVREVPPPDAVVPRRESIREDGFDEATLAAIEVADAAVAHAAAERAFLSHASDGTVAALAKLYTDGSVGQIEDVHTRAAHRRQGHAETVVLAAVAASRAAGHAVTFLWADEDDSPRELYAKLGFRVAGRRWRMRRTV